MTDYRRRVARLKQIAHMVFDDWLEKQLHGMIRSSLPKLPLVEMPNDSRRAPRNIVANRASSRRSCELPWFQQRTCDQWWRAERNSPRNDDAEAKQQITTLRKTQNYETTKNQNTNNQNKTMIPKWCQNEKRPTHDLKIIVRCIAAAARQWTI